MTMVATRALTKAQDKPDFTSMWCVGPDDVRLYLKGHGPGITFDYEHVEGCKCPPSGMPSCKPPVTVHGLRTKLKDIVRLAPNERPTLVPGDSLTFR